jgi:hypothetical protein
VGKEPLTLLNTGIAEVHAYRSWVARRVRTEKLQVDPIIARIRVDDLRNRNKPHTASSFRLRYMLPRIRVKNNNCVSPFELVQVCAQQERPHLTHPPRSIWVIIVYEHLSLVRVAEQGDPEPQRSQRVSDIRGIMSRVRQWPHPSGIGLVADDEGDPGWHCGGRGERTHGQQANEQQTEGSPRAGYYVLFSTES